MQVPTTLLSQVDSSVGGKTAIDSHHGKNLVGAFHQPVLVVADTALLDAITRSEFALNGFRNRDLRRLLFTEAAESPQQQRRRAAAVTRQLALLRAHHLIRKIQGTHRYQLTNQGRIILAALITARNANANSLAKLAA